MEEDPNSTNAGPLACSKAANIGVTPAVSQQYGTALPGSGTTASLTGIGTAWHVTTDLPVTMYDILPYGGASSYLPSAELLLPTTSWGTNYFGIVPQTRQLGAAMGPSRRDAGQHANHGVSERRAPRRKHRRNRRGRAGERRRRTYTLNSGQYIQWQESNEMSGTIISSNNPVGFFGGLGYDCYSDLDVGAAVVATPHTNKFRPCPRTDPNTPCRRTRRGGEQRNRSRFAIASSAR